MSTAEKTYFTVKRQSKHISQLI